MKPAKLEVGEIKHWIKNGEKFLVNDVLVCGLTLMFLFFKCYYGFEVHRNSYCWWWRCLCSCSSLTEWWPSQRWRQQSEPSDCCQHSPDNSPSSPSRTLQQLPLFHPSVRHHPDLHLPGCLGNRTNPVCGLDSTTCKPTAPLGSERTRCCTGREEPQTGTARHTSSRLSQTRERLNKQEGGHLREEGIRNKSQWRVKLGRVKKTTVRMIFKYTVCESPTGNAGGPISDLSSFQVINEGLFRMETSKCLSLDWRILNRRGKWMGAQEVHAGVLKTERGTRQ